MSQSVIFFDGVCNICNASVDFIIRRDKKNQFLLGALQDSLSKKVLKKYQVREDYLDSLVLLEGGKVYFKSTAALKIARKLSGIWPVFYPLIYLPKNLRDAVYDWIGNHRYKWFGKKNTCRIPSPEEESKFLSVDNIPT